MHGFKRMLPVMALAMLFTLLVTSCGGTDEPTTTTKPQTGTTTATTKPTTTNPVSDKPQYGGTLESVGETETPIASTKAIQHPGGPGPAISPKMKC